MTQSSDFRVVSSNKIGSQLVLKEIKKIIFPVVLKIINLFNFITQGLKI